MDKLITVPASAAGSRLDRFLAETLGITRSQVQKLIQHGGVAVNDAETSVHRWLKEGDRITIRESAPADSTPIPELTVLAETADYIVVEKPAGIIVHPAPGSSAPTLTSAVVRRFPEIVNVGAPGRPGIVHRLDRDVSGLLVVARTSAMYDELTRQFRDRHVHKVYTALVAEVVQKAEGTIDFPLARSRSRVGRMAARPKSQPGREAVTRFTVTKRFSHATLLAVELVTGRTHQIRAHLAAYGHPIVGDRMYGRSGKTELSRPFLEATTLGFIDLAGNPKEYTLPLDPELARYLAKLS